MNKLPEAYVSAGTKLETKTEVTARIDMSAEVAGKGLCPDCRKPMTTSHTNGHEVFVCHADRIAVPKADDGQEN